MLNLLFRHLIFFSLFLGISQVCWAQEMTPVLFKIDNEAVYTSEFIRMYNKQVEMLGVDDINSKRDYFDLFQDYKLKVKEARDKELDTSSSYKNELAAYRERLLQPYLKDEEASKFLIDEAYERTITQVNASHILIKLRPKFTVQDTVNAYNEISELRRRIMDGEEFEALAKSFSQDPSAKVNGGNLGFFSAFEMVYPFESAAYNTPVGEVSMPFRTSFGYHIVKTHSFKDLIGAREIAHIMIANKEDAGKVKIDSIFKVLKSNPESFSQLAEEFSDDSASTNKGGKLPKMNIGDAIESFEQVVFFDLKEEGEISQPFKTEFGWHIAKLLKLYPVPTKEEIYNELRKKVLADSRSSMEIKALVEKLTKQYSIKENIPVISDIASGNWSITDSNKGEIILTINEENYSLEDFILFLKRDKTNAGIDAFKEFREVQIVNYYKNHLEETNGNFKWTLAEFGEGLLLFNLMEQEVWNPSKNLIKQQEFYENHKRNYNGSFKTSQGKVISDYQKFLEEAWIETLKKKHSIEINSEELAKILNE